MDCFNCIFDDCIIDDKTAVKRPPKSRTEYMADYYQKNKEKLKKRMKENYEARKGRGK